MADFGLAKSTYEKLYFRQDKGDAVKLPIKWMAIESIDDGVFSEKSDVVSKVKPTLSVIIVHLITLPYLVGIWNNLLGDIQLWEGALRRLSSTELGKSVERWGENGSS